MKHTRRRNRFEFLIHIPFVLMSLCFILPMLYIVSVSLSNEQDILKYGYLLIPKRIDLTGYRFLFENPKQLIDSYKVTTFFTFVGTFFSTLIMALVSYPISRNSFTFRKPITFFIFFTMIFSGGLIPTYILITNYLHLQNSIWVYIVPGLASAFSINIFLSYFRTLPVSILESARIDGSSETRIFFQIVLPLSKPVVATVALFGLLGRWNDYFTSMLYISDRSLYSLQYLLQKIMLEIEFMRANFDKIPIYLMDKVKEMPAESTRMAIAVIAAGPMLLIFPFLQKYFTKGMTVGSLKG